MEQRRMDVWVLYIGGAVLLGLSGFFLWRDLQVRSEMLLVLGTLAAGAVALRSARDERALVGPAAVLACALLGGAWYAATREPILLVGLMVTLVISLVTVAVASRRAVTAEERWRAILLWYGLAVSALITSAAFYFQFLTLGFAQDETSRRLLLTLAWMACGVSLVVLARRRGQTVIRDAGFFFLGVAFLKAGLYDTTHLDGVARSAGLAVAGLQLLGGGWLTARSAQAKVSP